MKTCEEKLVTAVKEIISDAMGTDYQLSYYEIDKILQTVPSPPVTFQQAFDVFIKELKKDEKMYKKYQTKIAEDFVETHPNLTTAPEHLVSKIANKAAKNFLDSLIKEGKNEHNG